MSARPISTISDKRPDSGSTRSAWNDDGLDAPGRPMSGSSDASSAGAHRDTKSAVSTGKMEKKKRSKKPKKEGICSRFIGCKYFYYNLVKLILLLN